MMAERCKERIWHRHCSSQCTRKAGKDGYCTQHHPATIKARHAARNAKWQAKWDLQDANRAKYEREQAELELNAARYLYLKSLRSMEYRRGEGLSPECFFANGVWTYLVGLDANVDVAMARKS